MGYGRILWVRSLLLFIMPLLHSIPLFCIHGAAFYPLCLVFLHPSPKLMTDSIWESPGSEQLYCYPPGRSGIALLISKRCNFGTSCELAAQSWNLLEAHWNVMVERQGQGHTTCACESCHRKFGSVCETISRRILLSLKNPQGNPPPPRPVVQLVYRCFDFCATCLLIEVVCRRVQGLGEGHFGW